MNMSMSAHLILKRLVYPDLTLRNFFSVSSSIRFSRHLLRRKGRLVITDSTSSAVPVKEVANRESLVQLAHLKKSPPGVHQLFEDLEENDKLLAKTISSLSTRKFRAKKGKILLEGKHLIEVAISCGHFPEKVFYSRDEAVPRLNFPNSENVALMKVTGRALRRLSGSLEPPRVVGVCEKPVVSHSNSDDVLPVTILCSNIRNPENMGTIINVAAVSGCKSVLLTKGCVDPWERKVLKSAEGAHFFVPIVSNIEWYEINNQIPASAAVYIADSSADIDIADSQIYSDIDYSPNNVNTPLKELNYESSRDNERAVCEFKEETELLHIDEEFPCVLYSSVSFPKKDIIVYVGGETEGIDPRAKELVRDYGGMNVKIPLENDMDSLNVCSALSIIVYEMKRQFELKRSSSV